MAWHRPGNKPLSKAMMVRLPTHICVTRPQRVSGGYLTLQVVHHRGWARPGHHHVQKTEDVQWHDSSGEELPQGPHSGHTHPPGEGQLINRGPTAVKLPWIFLWVHWFLVGLPEISRVTLTCVGTWAPFHKGFISSKWKKYINICVTLLSMNSDWISGPGSHDTELSTAVTEVEC